MILFPLKWAPSSILVSFFHKITTLSCFDWFKSLHCQWLVQECLWNDSGDFPWSSLRIKPLTILHRASNNRIEKGNFHRFSYTFNFHLLHNSNCKLGATFVSLSLSQIVFHLMTTWCCWKFSKKKFKKKVLQSQLFLYIFKSEQEITIIEKRDLFSHFCYPLSSTWTNPFIFVRVQGQMVLSRLALVNPSYFLISVIP